MRKISFFNVVLFAAAMLFAGASLTSCGDDKDDNKENPENNQGGEGDESSTDKSSQLVGKWIRTTSEEFPGSDVTGKITVTHTRSYEFKSDKTFEFIGSDVTSYERSAPAETISRSYGTYSYDGEILKLTTTWTGFWFWDEERWQQQGSGEPFDTEYILTINKNSITIAPKNQPNAKETYTK